VVTIFAPFAAFRTRVTVLHVALGLQLMAAFFFILTSEMLKVNNNITIQVNSNPDFPRSVCFTVPFPCKLRGTALSPNLHSHHGGPSIDGTAKTK